MQKVEDFRKEVELRRRLERNQERFAPTTVLRTVSGPVFRIEFGEFTEELMKI